MNMRNKYRRSVVWNIPREKFENAVKESLTIADVIRKLGLEGSHGRYYKTIRDRIREEKIDDSHMNSYSSNSKRRGRYSLDEILVKNSTYTNRNKLKKRLIDEGLLENVCYDCGLGPSWNGKELVLHLEHKNGVNNDNRLENLCLLCPNCHSQTATYSGRNWGKYNGLYYKKKQVNRKCKKCSSPITRFSKTGLCTYCSNINKRIVDRPSKEQLLFLIKHKSFVSIGQKFGVSDNTVRKWCRYYGIPATKRELKKTAAK